MALDAATRKAIARYGPSVAQVARHYGISGQALLAKLVEGESGGRPDRTSTAGAKGYTQFIPSTRDATIRKFGIDPWHSADEAVHAAALHLRGKITGRAGLSGYNPGSSSYPDYILGQKVGDVGGSSAGGPMAQPGAPRGVTVTQSGTGFSAGSPQALSSLLAASTKPQAPVSAPQAPAHTAGLALPKGYQSPASEAPQTPAGGSALGDALASLSQGQTLPQINTTVSGGGGGAGGSSSVPSGGAKIAKFDGKPVAGWIAKELNYARQHGWKGTVSSGYRSYAEQKAIYDRGVRPAAKPGKSNHEFAGFPGGAVDVTDAPALARILARKGSPLKWAGSKDAVHFSHPHGGSY